jgi:hypothetical protein
MGRAEDLFDRLKQRGEAEIDQLIQDRQSEELFLDFKRSADNGSGRRFHDDDRRNLARAVSGFGNSEGGVIVWGVDCRERAGFCDLPGEKIGIDNPKRFVSWLEGAVSGCTIAPHPGVVHHAIDSGKGFVVTKSDLAPHQCIQGARQTTTFGRALTLRLSLTVCWPACSGGLHKPRFFTIGWRSHLR